MKKGIKRTICFFLFLFSFCLSLAFYEGVSAEEASPTPQTTEEPEPQEPVVTGIYIDKKELKNVKQEYSPGEELDPKGLTVYAIYKDGSEEKIDLNDLKFSGFTKKTGIYTITVDYQDFSDSYQVWVLPGQVKDFKVKENGLNYFTLNWSKVEDSSGYDLFLYNKSTNGMDRIAELKSGDTSYKVEGLPSGSVYKYLIRAYIIVDGEKKYGQNSDELNAATKPDKVEGLTVLTTETNAVTLQWNPAKGEVGYIIYQLNTSTMQYKKVASTKDTKYKVDGLKVATRYTYVVRAYALTESNVGDASEAVQVMTKPRAPEITLRAGNHRVRLTWNKIKEATGYIIWMKSEKDEEYVKIHVIEDVNVKEYVVKGLNEKQNYSFYIQTYTISQDAMLAESDPSLVKGIYISVYKGTSFKAVLYTTTKKFKKSPAYKGYKDFSSMVNLSKSYAIPGLKNTNVNGFNCTTMCPQAVTTAGPYLLMTAYDTKKIDPSVIYVLDYKTKKYLLTIALPNKTHAGGIAYDGKNIWLSNGKKVACIKFSTIKNLVKNGEDGVEVDYIANCSVSTKASSITYHSDRLWVGEFNEKSNKNMYSYEIKNKNGIPSLSRKNRIIIPSRTQGITFLKDGTMVMAVSNQTGPSASKYYISQLRVYKPEWKKSKSTGLIKKSKCSKVVTMPPMIEGLAMKGKYIYATFESAIFPKCKQRVDRICALKISQLLKINKKK